MTIGTYEKASLAARRTRDAGGFGGWLMLLWTLAALLVAWYAAAVIGEGRGLGAMFETPENVAIMRVVLWLKVWLWAPFLILAPLEHRLMPAVTIVMVLAAAIGEICAVAYVLELSREKVISVSAFSAAIASVVCLYLVFSKRVASIRASNRPVDVRVRRHFSLLVMVVGSVSIAIFGAGPETAVDRVSFLTAYLFMFLLTGVLTIGPMRTLRTGRTVHNIYGRRDIGIWVGVAGLTHLFAGTGESMTPAYVATFVSVAGNESAVVLRQQLFSWGALVGLVTTLFLLLPLVLSNDHSMRRLGKRWWKRLHRASYFLLALTVAHALAFQYLEDRVTWLVALVLLMSAWVVALQLAAFAKVRARRSRRKRVA